MKARISCGRVHYEVHGDGWPVVMLHGGPGDVGQMLGLVEPVFERTPGWQRLYFDLPGCGLTQADETVDCYDRVLDFVLEFIDQQLIGRRFALVGYSYGGYLARGVIRKRPGQVNGLCLIAPRIMQDRSKKTVPLHSTLFTEPGFLESLRAGEEWMPDHIVHQTNEGLKALREHFLPGLSLYDDERSEQFNQASPGLTFDVDDLPTPFEHPTLIVTGRQDSVTGYQDAWSLLDNYPRATYVVLDGAGHFLGMVEQVNLFRALVGEWLERLSKHGDTVDICE
jgi:pimeloyl-ACP methyl ester carboxylesterase